MVALEVAKSGRHQKSQSCLLLDTRYHGYVHVRSKTQHLLVQPSYREFPLAGGRRRPTPCSCEIADNLESICYHTLMFVRVYVCVRVRDRKSYFCIINVSMLMKLTSFSNHVTKLMAGMTYWHACTLVGSDSSRVIPSHVQTWLKCKCNTPTSGFVVQRSHVHGACGVLRACSQHLCGGVTRTGTRT